MERGWRFLILLFVLVLSIARQKAQDALDSRSVLDQNISFVQFVDPDLKDNTPNDQAQDFKPQNWSFHVQATEIGMGQPGFRSPYKGTNSIAPNDDFRQTSTFSVFLGAHLWPGGEVYFDGEYYQGFGFGNTHGIAAFPNAEGSKVGQRYGDLDLPHLFYRQTFGFGGEQEELEATESVSLCTQMKS
jgi:hypothetical protein